MTKRGQTPRDFPPERRAGARVLELRERAGISQRDFSDMLTEAGLPGSQPRISHIERGHYLLEKDEVVVLAKMFKVKVSQLLEGTDDAEAIKLRVKRDEELGKVDALEEKRAQLEAQLVEVDKAVRYHRSMARLWDSKIASIYHGELADPSA